MRAMVVFELQPGQTYKAVTVYQATPGKLFGKTLPGDPIREANIAAILRSQPRGYLDDGSRGTCEDWIDYAMNAMFNGYTTTAPVVPEKTIDMLYEREVLDVEPQPMIRPDRRPRLAALGLQGRPHAFTRRPGSVASRRSVLRS